MDVKQNTFTPQPKIKPIRLKGKKYTEFRKKLCKRANERCEVIKRVEGHFQSYFARCDKYAPPDVGGVFNEYICGHVSHIRHHSVGGGDTMANCLWSCFDCHRKKHNGRD
jgi:hypothetical protein